MTLTRKQKKFFEDNGYLRYGKVLSEDELDSLRNRCEDIASGVLTHLPKRFIQYEGKFSQQDDPDLMPIDKIRKMTHLTYFDELFKATVGKAEIVDVVEDLLGPDLKLYVDQLMMKPRFNGTVTDWHQDAVSWPFFIPQNHVSCWLALDDATVENGCMTMIPGSHKWGPVDRRYLRAFLDDPEIPEAVPVELKAGECLFHHALNFHRTGANPTPNRRRGLAMHYLRADTKYLGIEDEEMRLLIEAERPRGEFQFLHIRGRTFP
ncbi:MAG: phytanoyl-CoA dioxygenase family protein [Planctomycetota bacterium]|nr:phytanoyl-CoA dioxygenase family protein [Planctomycetota bacterium]MDA1143033.1 phytanoyl-CoA dioxygenase family protein [Planctomycetota bacterium]